MWLFAMFDLPTDTKRARKAYTQFRKRLIQHGFLMLQYSVYARYCANESDTKRFKRIIRSGLPDAGEVRIIAITDRQFGKMEVFSGKTRNKPEKAPEQLAFF